MKFEIDTLKCAKMLSSIGFEQTKAEGLAEVLAGSNVRNVYSKIEVDTMLSEAVKNTFEELRRESDKSFKIIEKQIVANEKRIEANEQRIIAAEARGETRFAQCLSEMRTSRRWIGGLIVASWISIAGYLSALIHFTH